MRTAVLGLFIGAGLAIVIAGVFFTGEKVFAERPIEMQGGRVITDSRMIALATTTVSGKQLVTLIDPHRKVMSVYHVELATGQISLKSVRNIRWDLQIDDFNGDSPLPKEIQAMLKR